MEVCVDMRGYVRGYVKYAQDKNGNEWINKRTIMSSDTSPHISTTGNTHTDILTLSRWFFTLSSGHAEFTSTSHPFHSLFHSLFRSIFLSSFFPPLIGHLFYSFLFFSFSFSLWWLVIVCLLCVYRVCYVCVWYCDMRGVCLWEREEREQNKSIRKHARHPNFFLNNLKRNGKMYLCNR